MTDDLRRLPGLATPALLLAALAGPPAFVVVADRLVGAAPSLGVQVVSQLIYCAMAGAVVWGVVRFERLPLRSIGVRRPDWTTVLSAALIVVAGLCLQALVVAPLAKSADAERLDAALRRLASLPPWFRVFVGITGGAVEETLYRGYAIERLAAVTGRWWLAGAIAAVAFTLAHVPAWGARYALTADLFAGVLLTLLYLWRRDLVANILAHGTTLVVAMLALSVRAH
jgi:membrane protease YdiL (CAAX protease family)